MRHGLRIHTIIAGAALVAVTACGKKDAGTADTMAVAPPTAAPGVPAAFAVADVDMGRHIGADKGISDKTDDFAPGDTIYASVHTTGAATGKALAAKWTFENGTTVHEESQSISPTGDAITEFHIVKPGGWPKGKYTFHLLVDGVEARTKDVTVK
jgi:hypothetical protein